ncbi:MAG: hypothetical protein HRF42_07250 [Candidatus Brocadia sp.]|jgi:transposase InsO family protein
MGVLEFFKKLNCYEFLSLEEAKEKLEKWFKEDYNKYYIHSTLEYRSPERI